MGIRINSRLAVPLTVLSLVLSSGISHAEDFERSQSAEEAGTFGGSEELGASAGHRLFSARRLTGIAFLGGSLLLLRKGNDYHDEADELYDRYEQADKVDEAERLYDKTTNRDVKSQVSWALAAAFAVNGARLVLTSHGHRLVNRPHRQVSWVEIDRSPGKVGDPEPGMWVEPWYDSGRLGLRLARSLGSI